MGKKVVGHLFGKPIVQNGENLKKAENILNSHELLFYDGEIRKTTELIPLSIGYTINNYNNSVYINGYIKDKELYSKQEGETINIYLDEIIVEQYDEGTTLESLRQFIEEKGFSLNIVYFDACSDNYQESKKLVQDFRIASYEQWQNPSFSYAENFGLYKTKLCEVVYMNSFYNTMLGFIINKQNLEFLSDDLTNPACIIPKVVDTVAMSTKLTWDLEEMDDEEFLNNINESKKILTVLNNDVPYYKEGQPVTSNKKYFGKFTFVPTKDMSLTFV